jgi:arylsulfatase
VKAIDDLGVMDNTLIIYITGDNGSSANGGQDGRFNSHYTFSQVADNSEMRSPARPRSPLYTA